jgi:hypothetical protein
VTYDFECKNLYPVEDGEPRIELDVEGTLLADPRTETSVDVEKIVKSEPPMVWKEVSESLGPFQTQVKSKLEPGSSSEAKPLRFRVQLCVLMTYSTTPYRRGRGKIGVSRR